MEITIGTKFVKRGSKRKDICTVIDILRTYNNNSELVKTMYVCSHELLGQQVTHEECRTTIVRSMLS